MPWLLWPKNEKREQKEALAFTEVSLKSWTVQWIVTTQWLGTTKDFKNHQDKSLRGLGITGWLAEIQVNQSPSHISKDSH